MAQPIMSSYSLLFSMLHPRGINRNNNILVLFVKKKDSLLCLCINFYSLNYISKKDCYLISNLLNSSYKAWVYTKIDLHHVYYLVHITNSNELKTNFRTCYGSFKWSIIHFGLTNTSVVFQQFINNLFSNCQDWRR